MDILTLDFETYFDADYTLRKMTTEAYVRDSRFEALCLGVKKGEAPARIWSDPLPHDTAFLCHHAQFDGLILSRHFGIRPAFWFDTLSMARLVYPHDKSHSLEALAAKLGLSAKTVPYDKFRGKRGADLDPATRQELEAGCCHDVELTYAIFRKLLPLVPRDELKLIDLTIRMFTEPELELNVPLAKSYAKELASKQGDLLAKLGVTREDLRSSDKFAELLRNMDVEPGTKKSASTGEQIYAFAKTDPFMVDLLDSGNEEISLLAEARLNSRSTIGETRAGRLISMASRGPLPVYLNFFGAHTGRWSGGDKVNFQNFPRGGQLRRCLEAPPGKVICVVDASQIECRVLNGWAKEDWVLEAFRQGRDLYSEGASEFYGRKITKVDKLERHMGKTIELGCGYGMGREKFRVTCKRGALGGPSIDLSEEDASRAIKVYRDSHPRVVGLWREADRVLRGMYHYPNFQHEWGYVRVRGRHVILPNHVALDYSSLDLREDGFFLPSRKGGTKLYGGKFVENIVQALARVLMGDAMLRIAKMGYKIVTTTHDEIVYLASEADASWALKVGIAAMKSVPTWCSNAPLDAEGGYAREYSK